MKIKDKNLYFVGGVVRDEILGQQSFDVDYCYEGNAIDFAQNMGLNLVKINPDFGTVRINYEGEEIDIASTRQEEYPHVGHLPVVSEIGCSLKDDLRRRDFTINAMAKNTITDEVTDYFCGLDDIKNKKLKVLHEKSFIEDPSRIIRGLKFSVRFGFELEEKTRKLQDEYLDNINYDLSYHRLKKELKETFNLNNELAYKKFLDQKIYRLLGEGQPTVQFITSPEKLINEYKPKHIWLVYLGAYGLKNFELNSEEADIIKGFEATKHLKPADRFSIYKTFCDKPLETVLIYALTIDKEIALDYLQNLRYITVETTGEDLLNLGIPQGKIYKEIFEFLLKNKIENPKISKQEELELVRGMNL